MEDLALEAVSEGVILPVKASPGAKKNELRGVVAGALRVCCTQVPEKGKANRALVEVLARELKLRRSQITLLSGETDAHKRFLVQGVGVEELFSKILACSERK